MGPVRRRARVAPDCVSGRHRGRAAHAAGPVWMVGGREAGNLSRTRAVRLDEPPWAAACTPCRAVAPASPLAAGTQRPQAFHRFSGVDGRRLRRGAPGTQRGRRHRLPTSCSRRIALSITRSSFSIPGLRLVPDRWADYNAAGAVGRARRCRRRRDGGALSGRQVHHGHRSADMSRRAGPRLQLMD